MPLRCCPFSFRFCVGASLFSPSPTHPLTLTVISLSQSAVAEKTGLTEHLVLAEERQLELEAEVRGLKAAVVDAQTNAEQLEEMSR